MAGSKALAETRGIRIDGKTSVQVLIAVVDEIAVFRSSKCRQPLVHWGRGDDENFVECGVFSCQQSSVNRAGISIKCSMRICVYCGKEDDDNFTQRIHKCASDCSRKHRVHARLDAGETEFAEEFQRVKRRTVLLLLLFYI